jgi:hypothetical protein
MGKRYPHSRHDMSEPCKAGEWTDPVHVVIRVVEDEANLSRIRMSNERAKMLIRRTNLGEMRCKNRRNRGHIDLLIIPGLLIESICEDGLAAILGIVICQEAPAGMDLTISCHRSTSFVLKSHIRKAFGARIERTAQHRVVRV